MSNILDYIAWRGDLSLMESPFNDVDALILCQIAYLNFDGLLAEGDFRTRVPLAELAAKFRLAPDFQKRSDTGALINRQTVRLLFDAADSARFGGIAVTGYSSVIDLEKEEQFSAVTFLPGGGTVFVAYRGTDDTIVGWKEDFNLAILDAVPAQLDAVKYLETAARTLRGRLCVGGHSKGGNLAVYASARARAGVRRRVARVCNYDGPGFPDRVIASGEFAAVIPKIRSFYPHFSIVGMLFSHAGKYSVVESDQSGIMQHDPFSWHVLRSGFVLLDGFDPASKFFHETFNDWICSLSREQRELFLEALFGVIQATEARTNSELEENLLRNSVKIVRALGQLDRRTRLAVAKTMRLLFRIARRKLPDMLSFSEKTSAS